MGRRPLLTDEERRLLLGVPGDADSLARHYTFTRSGPGSSRPLPQGPRLPTASSFAVQLALLRHPGRAFPNRDEPVDALVAWLAAHFELPVAAPHLDCRAAAGRIRRGAAADVARRTRSLAASATQAKARG